MKIGIFDSGIGGQCILRACEKLMPEHTYVYLADTAHMPYGDKTAQQLYEYTTTALQKLLGSDDCSIVIIACNSATTVLPRIQQEWLPAHFPQKKVLGVIKPTVEYLFEHDLRENIALLATAATVRSHSYDKEIAKYAKEAGKPEIEVFSLACPLLAPWIESHGTEESTELDQMIKVYVEQIPFTPTVVVLACTHYEHVEETIARFLPPGTLILTQGDLCASKLRQYIAIKAIK